MQALVFFANWSTYFQIAINLHTVVNINSTAHAVVMITLLLITARHHKAKQSITYHSKSNMSGWHLGPYYFTKLLPGAHDSGHTCAIPENGISQGFCVKGVKINTP